MSHLRRTLAPLSEAVWTQVDEEVTRALTLALGARKVVDVAGPLGWETDAVPTGIAEPLVTAPNDGVVAALRRPQALVELRTPFTLSLTNLDAAERSATLLDTAPLLRAARAAARTEDDLVFDGFAAAGITGLLPASPHPVLELATEATGYPVAVGRAVQLLRDAGIDGPYALALGDAEYTAVSEATERGGFPVVQHLRAILGGEVVWAPTLSGGVVLSQRGGDFALSLGQDFSIGYRGTDGDSVQLYLEESATFLALTPEAAVRLTAG